MGGVGLDDEIANGDIKGVKLLHLAPVSLDREDWALAEADALRKLDGG